MTKTDHNHKHEQWKKLVDEQQASGMSQKEFCRQHDLVISCVNHVIDFNKMLQFAIDRGLRKAMLDNLDISTDSESLDELDINYISNSITR